jgi:hypothetical protein
MNVGPDIGLPEPLELRIWGPDPEEIVIVVFKDDPAAGPEGPDHRPHDREGIGHMLQEEPRVRHVETPPFVAEERRSFGDACPKPDPVPRTGGSAEPFGLRDLPRVTFDPQQPAPRSGGASHLQREQLSNPVEATILAHRLDARSCISTLRRQGLDDLAAIVEKKAEDLLHVVDLRIPASDGRALALVARTGRVISRRSDGEMCHITASLPPAALGPLQTYLER